MALRESHDFVNIPEIGENIWPTSKDNVPVFRNPFYVVPKIPMSSEGFKKYLDSKPEERPETLHEIMKQTTTKIDKTKEWKRPEGIARKVWMRTKVRRAKKMSKYQVIPGYPVKEDTSVSEDNSQGESEVLSNASLTADIRNKESNTEKLDEGKYRTEIKRKHRWLEGTFVPKGRQLRWPGIRVPKTSQRRPRSDFLQRLEKTRVEDTYRQIFAIKEEHLKSPEELELERDKLKREQEEEKEREIALHKAQKVDRTPIRGAIKGIVNIEEGGDVPIDIFELDSFCRRPQPDIETLPGTMQQEERANRAFIDYLDQNGISEMLIGTLYMILSNPGPQENAKELLRLGLGGKPMETANVDDALQNIQATKDRIVELKKERHALQAKLLRLLKDNELPDEPIDPNNFEFPLRRMDYLFKSFLCQTRPFHVPVSEIYDLPQEIIKLIKYNVSTSGYETRGMDKFLKDASTQLDYRPQ